MEILKPKTPPVINYQAVITTNSWWKDVKGRIWVIISRQCTPEKLQDDLQFIPSSVKLLEQFKTEPVEQPWDYVVELIESGKFMALKTS